MLSNVTKPSELYTIWLFSTYLYTYSLIVIRNFVWVSPRPWNWLGICILWTPSRVLIVSHNMPPELPNGRFKLISFAAWPAPRYKGILQLSQAQHLSI